MLCFRARGGLRGTSCRSRATNKRTTWRFQGFFLGDGDTSPRLTFHQVFLGRLYGRRPAAFYRRAVIALFEIDADRER
jgi:hypothetical protein